jgi:hypothetical protein
VHFKSLCIQYKLNDLESEHIAKNGNMTIITHYIDHPLRERIKTLNRLNSERRIKGFAQFTFQPSRTYVQYDLAAFVSVPDIDETMTDKPKCFLKRTRKNYK